MKAQITKEILANADIVEGPMFEKLFLDRVNDEMYETLYVDEIIKSVRKGVHGYIIVNSYKYHRELINLIVEYRGHRYGLGIQNKNGKIYVNTFLTEGMIDYSMDRPKDFPQFFL